MNADLSNEVGVATLIEQASASTPVTCLINNASVFEYDESDARIVILGPSHGRESLGATTPVPSILGRLAKRHKWKHR